MNRRRYFVTSIFFKTIDKQPKEKKVDLFQTWWVLLLVALLCVHI